MDVKLMMMMMMMMGMISRVQDEVYVYFRMGCGIQSSG